MPWIARDRAERVRHRPKEDPVDDALVVQGERTEGGWQGEDHMEVRHRQ